MVALVAGLAVSAGAAMADSPSVNVGVDFYNRYVWRGSDIGNSPSIQPAVSATGYGLTLGAWGAYSTSSVSSGNDEIDFWADYTVKRENGVALKLIMTDYTYPNSGISYSKSDAHTFEAGAAFIGPPGFPLTVSGYVNVSNDPGNNTYFQLDYPATAGAVELGFFVGAAGGSTENPDYYDTETANVINMGMSARRTIAVTERFSLPLTGLLIYNPKAAIAHVVVGFSF
jgi:hypothetical protein